MFFAPRNTRLAKNDRPLLASRCSTGEWRLSRRGVGPPFAATGELHHQPRRRFQGFAPRTPPIGNFNYAKPLVGGSGGAS